MLLLTLAACSCQQAGAPCEESADCPGGQVCAEGYCRLACNTRVDCLDEEACIEGACLPARDRPDAGLADVSGVDQARADRERDDASRVDTSAIDVADASATDGAAGLDAALQDLAVNDRADPDLATSDASAVDQVTSTCGDSIVASGETCDDGYRIDGDGCSADCQIEPRWSCEGEPSTCYLCGDGVRDPTETCDDGYNDACGSCNATCDAPGADSLCGDGDRCPEREVCDHGADNRDDYERTPRCNTACTGYAPHCGDGLVDEGYEICDSGPANGDDWSLTAHCNAVCMSTNPFCGDGQVEPQTDEQCDDGNSHHHDACRACTSAVALADTGQGDCYDGVDDLDACPEHGLAYSGQDAQFGPIAMSFTDIGDGTIADHFTGLFWSQATQGDDDWQGAADACASSTLGGRSGWRLPSVQELRLLANYGRRDPALDPGFNLDHNRHWASDRLAGSASQAWTVHVKEGQSSPDDVGGLNSYTCVRGAPLPAIQRSAGSETVVDTTYGLEWGLGAAAGPADWQAALALCAALDLEGPGWRLPNIKELGTLFAPEQTEPAVLTALFTTSAGSSLWSSTSHLRSRNNAVVLRLGAGEIDWEDKGESLQLRCVRDVAAAPTPLPLPDTGQTGCFDLSARVRCPEAGLPLSGQDAQHGSNMRSFVTQADGSVTDPITGLTWLPLSQGIQPQPNALNDCQEREERGYSDWRLPSLDELLSLLHLGLSAPSASAALQLYTTPYWTTTRYPPFEGADTHYFTVDFHQQLVAPTSTYSVGRRLCVRGPPLPESVYLDLGPTVADEIYGLRWEATPDAGERDWAQALAYCADLELEGADDWRLPNARELQTLHAPGQDAPAIDVAMFPTTVNGIYWSSSTAPADPAMAWAVDFEHGIAGSLEKIFAQGQARCVRDLD